MSPSNTDVHLQIQAYSNTKYDKIKIRNIFAVPQKVN